MTSFELFHEHLPTRVQSILAAISPLTLEKAAEVADRVMEVTPIAVSACSVSSDKNSIESHVLKEIKLNLRIDEISRSRSRSRNRNLPFHKRNRSKSKDIRAVLVPLQIWLSSSKMSPSM
ncbi:hypothetical protein TNCV_4824341 [Trichonephila clavipes]|nr:hypothetical protein TNCV_4824341 [Trichonephila clavipes]